MSNNRHLFARSGTVNKALLIALVLSLLLHIALLTGISGLIPQWHTQNKTSLQVKLVTKPVPPAPLPPPEVRPEPKPIEPPPPKPRAPKSKVVKPKPQPPQTTQNEEIPPPVRKTISELESETPISPHESMGDTSSQESTADTTPSNAHAEPPSKPEQATIAPFTPGEAPYTKIHISYSILQGEATDAGKIGEGEFSFDENEQHGYTIHTLVKASGVISLFFSGTREETSTGVVTENGLRPNEYRSLRSDKPEKTRVATFNWQSGIIDFTEKGETHSNDLPPRAQDMASLLFNFMFIPPQQQMRITVTDGRKIKYYAYLIKDEETLTIDGQDYVTLHLSKIADSADDKLDVWLAKDHFNIPLKIQKTDEKGMVYTLIARNLVLGAGTTQ